MQGFFGSITNEKSLLGNLLIALSVDELSIKPACVNPY